MPLQMQRTPSSMGASFTFPNPGAQLTITEATKMRCAVCFRFAFIILCLHSLAVIQSTRVPAHAAQNRETTVFPVTGRTTNQTLTGLYLGISDGHLGNRAWLLSLDSRTGRGILYMTPNNLELVDLKFSQSGRLTFRSVKDIGDVIYLFDGTVGASGIAGQFRNTRQGQGENAETPSFPVTMTKLDLSSSGSRLGVSGLYSNVRYSAEGGDLIGAELVLFWHGGKPAMIFTSYNNEMLPYSATNIVQSRNIIRFRVRTATGEESYSAVISAQRTTLRRIDAKADPSAWPVILRKRKELANIFTMKRLARRS